MKMLIMTDSSQRSNDLWNRWTPYPIELLSDSNQLEIAISLPFTAIRYVWPHRTIIIVYFFFNADNYYGYFIEISGSGFDRTEKSGQYVLHELNSAVYEQHYVVDQLFRRWQFPVCRPMRDRVSLIIINFFFLPIFFFFFLTETFWIKRRRWLAAILPKNWPPYWKPCGAINTVPFP